MFNVKYIASLALCLFALSNLSNANELGKRYLKLGNTYRESSKYDKSEEYLKRGEKLVKGDSYWSAAADEYFGYLYRDMAKSGEYSSNTQYFYALAKEHLENALSKYRKIIKQSDGSPSALNGLQNAIDDINNMMTNDKLPTTGIANNYGRDSKIVNLDNSKLKNIPNDLPTTMENFSAVNNRLKDFQTLNTRYPKLQAINLKNNRISSIANGLGNIVNLKYLNMSGNRIKTMSDDLSSLKKIEVLDLSNNKLRSIPTTLTALQSLKVLDISGNNIPFSQIATLIKNMPSTNIVFDRYIRESDEDNSGE